MNESFTEKKDLIKRLNQTEVASNGNTNSNLEKKPTNPLKNIFNLGADKS